MSEFSGESFTGSALRCVRGGRRIFDALDFTLQAGGALILSGPNGSGKSSLLRLMAGLSPPAQGTIAWDGLAISTDREAHGARLHYVGHADALKPTLTTTEMLGFWATLRGVEGARLQAALAHLGLADRVDFPGRYLSAGQRRRLALARLIAIPAPLWLLDEATVGLDRDGVAVLEAMIKTHREAGGMVVLATHIPVDLGATHQELGLTQFAASGLDAVVDPFAEFAT